MAISRRQVRYKRRFEEAARRHGAALSAWEGREPQTAILTHRYFPGVFRLSDRGDWQYRIGEQQVAAGVQVRC
jgi:hypothetical protein